MTPRPRVGLVGTGPWARMVHAPAAASSDDVDFVAVWGRSREAAERLAAEHGVVAAVSFEALVELVDIVVFAVPPDVQQPLALAAAAAGRHVLLEKPTAFSVADAEAVADALETRGLASVVFFTAQLDPALDDWIRSARSQGAWLLSVRNLTDTLRDPDNPFGASPWRHERGLLWDSGAHDIALALRLLGAVTEVGCVRGPGDLAILVAGHEGGGRTELVIRGDSPVVESELRVLTEHGSTRPPDTPWGELAAASARRALSMLADAASGRDVDIELDARFGVAVTRVLAAAQRSVDEGVTQRS